MKQYLYEIQNNYCQIDISKRENELILKGQTNINNNIYYLFLNLQELHRHEFFQRCNSINEVFDLVTISLDTNI